jgi:hypothetical protein
MDLTTRVELLEARAELLDLVSRCAQGYDSRDPDLVRTVFHDDASVDLGATLGRAEGFEAILTDAERFWTAASSMHHWTANSIVNVDPTSGAATADTALDCLCTFADGTTYHCGGRYRDAFLKRDTRWALISRHYEVQFMTPLAGWTPESGSEAAQAE